MDKDTKMESGSKKRENPLLVRLSLALLFLGAATILPLSYLAGHF